MGPFLVAYSDRNLRILKYNIGYTSFYFTYDTYYGTQRPGKLISMLNTQEYAQLEWESRINSKSVGAKGNAVHSQFGNGATPVILEAIVASNQYKLMDLRR